jgi:hypothetical protein
MWSRSGRWEKLLVKEEEEEGLRAGAGEEQD